jgi:hypothetical protein
MPEPQLFRVLDLNLEQDFTFEAFENPADPWEATLLWMSKAPDSIQSIILYLSKDGPIVKNNGCEYPKAYEYLYTQALFLAGQWMGRKIIKAQGDNTTPKGS